MFTLEKTFQDLMAETGAGQGEPEKELVVVHTTTTGTRAALRMAANLGNGLYTHIRLIAPRIVPYPLLLTDPPVPAEFTEQYFLELVAEIPVNTRIDIRNCRDAVEMLRSALKPGSLVVIGKRARWWFSAEARLAKTLRAMGHAVVVSEFH